MSIEPDWDAWERLPAAQKAARLQGRHLNDTGRELPVREAALIRAPSAAARARASLASDPAPRSDVELTRTVKERERQQARELVRPSSPARTPRGSR